jgi:hypothetical protein
MLIQLSGGYINHPLLYFSVYTKAEQGSCTSLRAAASPESTEANSTEHFVPITKKRKATRKANTSSAELAESRGPGVLDGERGGKQRLHIVRGKGSPWLYPFYCIRARVAHSDVIMFA